MNQEDIIENLFTVKYTHDEKIDMLAKLERENAPLCDDLIKKHHPYFWSENYICNVPNGYQFAGYERHLMSMTLFIALEKYQKDSNYHPKLDMSINGDLFNLLTNK